MTGLLDGKSVLITGAGGGIGRASALRAAEEGARVMAADLNADAVAETADLIRSAGGTAFSQACDVTDGAQVDDLIARTVSELGGLNGAYNNAGVEGEPGRIDKMDDQNFDFTMNVNLRGVFLCIRAETRYMLENGGGSIINTASVAGIAGATRLSAYVASKHGVVGLTKSASMEYGTKGIRVNAICPGPIRTRMLESLMNSHPDVEKALYGHTAMKRLGEAREIANAAVWLLSDQSSYVTGIAMPVDGGMTAGH